jgi:hypothetical protein
MANVYLSVTQADPLLLANTRETALRTCESALEENPGMALANHALVRSRAPWDCATFLISTDVVDRSKIPTGPVGLRGDVTL